MDLPTAFLLTPYQSTKALTEYNTLGTDPNNSIRFDSNVASARHARIELRPEGYLIRDLRSEAGTFVNGTRINEAYLQDGDQISLASEEFTFLLEIASAKGTGIGLKSKNETWNSELQRLGNVARTEYPILLLGASGTGKEVLAQALHQNSDRARGPFVWVNCSALTETLVESELFGHVKGSFTGAIADRKGAFESARGGTLFLDEIGDLPYGLQAKLLRALENNEIRPVGSDRTIHTDVRILAATHQNLAEKVQSQEFRSDLYYRLNVVPITPPVLTQRMEDFEDLFYTFARQMRVRFSFGAIQRLKQHSWPGNIRELKNTVARASAFFPRQCVDESHVERILDAPVHGLRASANGMNEGAPMPVIKEIEKQMILKRLAANKGNQRRTASDLGMPKSTLHDRLRLYEIDPRQFGERSPKIQRVAVPHDAAIPAGCI